MASYKYDFEEERKDRVSAHSKMADMEKKMTQIQGLSGHEKAAMELEVDELKKDKDTILKQLRIRDEELQTATKQLQSHKQILSDLELVHQRRIQEASKEIVQLKSQIKSEQQAKASQVRQYAKENETLQQQVTN